jgi:hypothetical protein
VLCIEYGEAIIKELIFWKYSKNKGHLAEQLLAQLYKIQDTSMTSHSLSALQRLLLQTAWQTRSRSPSHESPVTHQNKQIFQPWITMDKTESLPERKQ